MRRRAQQTTTTSFETIEKKRIVAIAEKLYPNYKFDADNRNVFAALFEYFNKDTHFNKRSQSGYKYSLDKGILLIGNIGSGKTAIMNIFLEYMRGKEGNFIMISAKELEREYATNGFNNIKQFYNNPTTNIRGGTENSPKNICVDDIGTEIGDASHYGTKQNIVRELLYERNDYMNHYDVVTHATTNCKLGQLQKLYGDILYSRFNEMFNYVKVTSEDRRIKL